MKNSRQALLYLHASIVGTLANFFSRFLFADLVGFGWSLILANYVGMVIVFLLSYRYAFRVQIIQWRMVLKFTMVAHLGLLVVWFTATTLHHVVYGLINFLFDNSMYSLVFINSTSDAFAVWAVRLVDGCCHGFGIICGFLINFFGHKYFSFVPSTSGKLSI